VRRATGPRRRRFLEHNQITGTFPLALCEVDNCYAKYGGNDLVAPCGTTDCCDLGRGAACPPTNKPTVFPKGWEDDPCYLGSAAWLATSGYYLQIFDQCIDPRETTELRVPPRP
jgi:hypothetical protein